MASTDLVVRLLGDTRDLKKDLNKATGSMAKFQKQAKRLGAGLIAAFGTQQIVQFGKESLRLFDIQQKSEARLLTALKGRVDVQQRLIRQAQDLQSQTLFGDEETIQAQATLATLGLTENQIRELTPLVQDLSAATGRDLAKAAKEVTTAVATGSTTLEKYGVELKTSNTLAENLKLTVEGLSDSVGGQAKAAAEAGTGALTQLSNSFGDLQEKIGEILNRQGGVVSFFDELTQATTKLIDTLDEDEISFFDKLTAFVGTATNNPAALIGLTAQKAAIDAQKESLNDLRSGYFEHNAMLEEQAAAAKAAADEQKRLAGILASQQSEVGASVSGISQFAVMATDAGLYASAIEKVKVKTQELTRINMGFFTQFKETGQATFMNMAAVIQDFGSSVLVGFAEDIGNALSGVGQFGENILQAVGSFMKRLGEQMIQLGLAKALLDKLSAALPGGVLIAAGVALVAASTAISNTLSGGMGGASASGSGGGGGGSVSNGQSVGLGANRAQDKMDINITGKIKGQDLIFVQEKAQRDRGIRG